MQVYWMDLKKGGNKIKYWWIVNSERFSFERLSIIKHFPCYRIFKWREFDKAVLFVRAEFKNGIFEDRLEQLFECSLVESIWVVAYVKFSCWDEIVLSGSNNFLSPIVRQPRTARDWRLRVDHTCWRRDVLKPNKGNSLFR